MIIKINIFEENSTYRHRIIQKYSNAPACNQKDDITAQSLLSNYIERKIQKEHDEKVSLANAEG